MHQLPPRSHISLSIKTHSSFGLIFYVSDKQEDNFMALFLDHGKLVYTFNVADQRVKLKSENKYNEGAWHNVSSVKVYTCNFSLLVLQWQPSLFSEGYFYPRWEYGAINNWWAHHARRHSSGKQCLLAHQQSHLCRRSSSRESPEECSSEFMWKRFNITQHRSTETHEYSIKVYCS